MQRYASRYKTVYRNTDYFTDQTIQKYCSILSKPNFFKQYYSTSYMTFSPQRSLKFSLTKMPDRRIKTILTIKSDLHVAHQRESERLSIFPII